MQWLRHSAVKKFLSWRRQQLANPLDIQATTQLLDTAVPISATSTSASVHPCPSCSTISTPSGVLVPHHNSSFYRSTSPTPSEHSLSLHSHHSQVLALPPTAPIDLTFRSVRLAKWALDLQTSLESERRAQAQRLHPSTSSPSALVRHTPTPHSTTPPHKIGTINPHDPLNLLNPRLSWPTTLRLLGIGSALGALALYLVRNWHSISDTVFGSSSSYSPTPSYGSLFTATPHDDWFAHLPWRDGRSEGSHWGLRDVFSSAAAGQGQGSMAGYALVGPPVMGFDGSRREGAGWWSEIVAEYGIGGDWLRNFGWRDWGLGEGWGLRA